MKLKMVGDSSMDSGTWDFLVASLSKVKNRNYDEIIFEIRRSMNPDRKTDFVFDKAMYVNIAGISADDIYSIDYRKKGNETEMTLSVFDKKKMEKEGWTPKKDKQGNVILWVRSPFIVSCVDFNGKKLDDSMKGYFNFLFSEMSKLPKFEYKMDKKKMVSDFRKLIDSGKKKEIASSKRNIKSYTDKISYYSSELANLYTSMRKEMQRVKAYEGIVVMRKTDIDKMIETIMNMKDVYSITTEGSNITVITKPIIGTVLDGELKGRKYKLGRFAITWGENQNMKIVNLDKDVEYPYDHPHIDRGVPCFGNMDEITKYAMEMRIDVVVQLVLSYLESLSEDGVWYEDPDIWVKGAGIA
jgi:hypothetical protein